VLPVSDEQATGAGDTDDVALLRRFEPIIRFTQGEYFLPASVDDYVRQCELLEHAVKGDAAIVAPKGSLTLDRLVELGRDQPRPGQYLRFVDQPFSRFEVARWRVRGDRPRFHGAVRLARVGVLSRGLDALSRASLIFRGSNAGGAEAAAETQYRTAMRPDHHPYYGRVVRDSGYTVLQYWYFYAYNDWRSRVYGVNDHEADWEQVIIYLASEGDDLRPVWIAASAHDEVGDDLRRRWDDPDLTLVGEHPVIHAGLGSHSGAYLAGDYLTTHDIPAFARLLRWTRRVSRTFLPWTRDQDHVGLSIPYVDYSRGDGVSIGPGQQRSWDPEVIDESTPWVMHYRGLWGNDTQDPLGGERGPAGPRYERSGRVRTSWGDPVGWAGLRKVAPDPRSSITILEERLTELDGELEQLDAEITQRQRRQRAAVASGESVPITDETGLNALVAERVALRDERLLVSRRIDEPPAERGVHEHLRHRRVPLPTETRGRRRVLAIWSAISTSAILVVALLVVVERGWTIDTIGIEVLIGLFAIEALARKHLLRFALLVAAAFVVGTIAVAASQQVIADWRIIVAALLALAAAALLVLNVRELLRD
jgi:hypothetical protein